MQFLEGRILYSGADIYRFGECRHLTALDERVALGLSPALDESEEHDLLSRKGIEHAKRFIESLSAAGCEPVSIDEAGDFATLSGLRASEDRTLAAMSEGHEWIVRGMFFDGRFSGRVDVLRRVERPARDWAWSYEPVIVKLARAPKPQFVVQLCHYGEHLERLQGVAPQRGTIVLGDGREMHVAIDEYAPYYRRLKNRFLESIPQNAEPRPAIYPVPVRFCRSCDWENACLERRVRDDHLSLVASIRRDQIVKLERTGITSLQTLAQAGDELRPAGMTEPTYDAIRHQARVQYQGRVEGRASYEFLGSTANRGFGLLPEPAAGDIFFDMEGDPFYEPGRGLEYLFGCWLPDDVPNFRAFWARERDSERAAFEAFIDFVGARRKRCPNLRIYHYANYEKAALQRLAQYYGTREDEVDDLLRSEVLVDLYTVVRQALVISERSYGLKQLERFYGLERQTAVKRGDDSIMMFERWLDEPDRTDILEDIERYNADDCRSTYLLRNWLLELRQRYVDESAVDLPYNALKRPDAPCHEPRDAAACRQCAKDEAAEREERQRGDLERRLLAGVAIPLTEAAYRAMSRSDRERYLLGNLLAYHRREEKPAWWTFFYRCENPDQLTEFDAEAIGSLQLAEEHPPYKQGADRHAVFTYTFPEQTHNLHRGDVYDPDSRKKAGSVVEIDDLRGLLKLKRAGGIEEARDLRAVIPRDILPTGLQQDALARVATSYLAGNLGQRHSAVLDLLRGEPRRHGGATFQPESVSAEAISEVARDLADSYLFIQGPPGSGKSTVAAHVICDLLEAGKRVGVMSNGHKPVHHLLSNVERTMQRRGKRFDGLYKYSKSTEGSEYVSPLAEPMVRSHQDAALCDGTAFDLAGGTAWLFSRPALERTFDYLFIDEAGQVSLADAVAVAACARNVILLGDPLQLAQVSQGSHPVHAAESVLSHVLGSAHTIAPDRGIFLDVSYRLQPQICAFISDTMYDGRLQPAPETAQHCVRSVGFDGGGLRVMLVDHDGNTRSSREEAAYIAREIGLLCRGSLIDSDGVERAFTAEDAIVVTPYNAQRKCIEGTLRAAGISSKVGTVDKFQGQEAAVVFFSLASSGGDVARGVDFLYDANRLNVAISRARALAVVVASPKLFDLQASSIADMQAVARLCRYAECATSQADDRLAAGHSGGGAEYALTYERTP